MKTQRKMKMKVAPEIDGVCFKRAQRAITHGTLQICPVELFQTSATRSVKNEYSSLNGKKKTDTDYLTEGMFMGIRGCPTNLFMAKSTTVTEDRKTDLLCRHEVDEHFDLIFQTKELNKLSKDSRLDWLIEAVGGDRKQAKTTSEDIPPQKESSSFWSFRKRLERCWRNLRKVTRRGRVDVLHDRHV